MPTPVPLERLTTEYWRAARLLNGYRDAGLRSETCAQYMLSLARHCTHDRLRCAAGGALVTAGLRNLPGGGQAA